MTNPPTAALMPAAVPPDELREIEIRLIRPNPAQPRREFPDDEISALGANFQRHGMKNPPRVTIVGEEYQLIGGERRLRGARAAGWTKLYCLVTHRSLSRGELLLDQAVDNGDRKDFDPSERAELYYGLQCEFGWEPEELAENLPGTSVTTVKNYLSLRRLPGDVLDNVDHGEVPVTFAFEIAKLPNHQAMREMRTKVISEQLTADQLAAVIRRRTLGFGRRLRGRRSGRGVERGTRLAISVERGTKVSVSSTKNLTPLEVADRLMRALREAIADIGAEGTAAAEKAGELPVLTPKILLEMLECIRRSGPELDHTAGTYLAPIAPFIIFQLLLPMADEDKRVRRQAVDALNMMDGDARLVVMMLGRILRKQAADDGEAATPPPDAPAGAGGE